MDVVRQGGDLQQHQRGRQHSRMLRRWMGRDVAGWRLRERRVKEMVIGVMKSQEIEIEGDW